MGADRLGRSTGERPDLGKFPERRVMPITVTAIRLGTLAGALFRRIMEICRATKFGFTNADALYARYSSMFWSSLVYGIEQGQTPCVSLV